LGDIVRWLGGEYKLMLFFCLNFFFFCSLAGFDRSEMNMKSVENVNNPLLDVAKKELFE